MSDSNKTVSSSDAAARKARNARRKRVKWLKRIVVLLVAIGLAAAAVVAMLPKPLPVDLIALEQGPMVVTVNEDGKSRVHHRYVVTTPLAGIIPRLDFDEGDDVKQGEVLVRVVPANPPLLDARTKAESQARLGASQADLRRSKASVTSAEVAKKQAESVRERQRKLAAKGASPKSARERAEFEAEAREADLAAAKFSVKVAAQQVASARAALGLLSKRTKNDQLEVMAPTSGRVLRVFRRDEGVVNAGTRLMELGDPATLEVVVDVLTRDAVRVRAGSPARIIRWGGEPLAGVVRRVEPSGFTRISALGVEEQRVNVVIDIKEKREQWQTLGDGFRVEVEIEVWRAESVVKAPASAVFRHQEGWAAFAVVDGAAKLTPVEIGERNATHVEIVSGLKAGAQIILHPGDQIADGLDVVSRAAN